MRPLDPRLLRYARSTRLLIAAAAVAAVGSASATVAMAVAVADLVTSYAIDHTAPASWAAPVFIGAVLVKSLAVGAAVSVPRRSAVRLTAELRGALLDRVAHQDQSWTVRQRPAELIQLATAGVASLQNYASRYLPQLVVAALVPAGVLGYVASQDWLSALIVGLTLPLVPLFMALVGMYTRDHTQRSWLALRVLGGHFLDLIGGLPTLKVFGRSRSQERGIRDAGERYRDATLATLRVAFLSSMVLELIATISVALVAVSIGLRLIGGTMDLRTGLAVLLVAPEAFAALRAVGTQFHAAADGLQAAGEIFRVLDEPVPTPGDLPAPAGPALIDATLHGVHLDLRLLESGVTLLTGPSGVGKSTALSLLAGLARPDRGRVSIDGTDLADIDPALWRQRVAMLVQDPHLQAGPLLESLRVLRPGATVADVELALWCAAADEVVAELPGGLSAVLGEGAPELSHGQRARLALARTLVSTAPVLLLDEPSAALDERTEAVLVARLGAALAGRTVLIASHRPALRAVADRIIVLPVAGPPQPTSQELAAPVAVGAESGAVVDTAAPPEAPAVVAAPSPRVPR